MKLYRGLKSSEYREFTPEILEQYQNGWKKILALREQGSFEYPEGLNDEIITLFKNQYLVRQYFTDRKDTAERYAKEVSGVLLEIDVSLEDLTKYFILEFQNYSKRKELFEITYIVKGNDLVENSEKWKLKVHTNKT